MQKVANARKINHADCKCNKQGLKAQGTAVSIDATHQCMTTKSVMKENATTVTNYFTGSFKIVKTYNKDFNINQKK